MELNDYKSILEQMASLVVSMKEFHESLEIEKKLFSDFDIKIKETTKNQKIENSKFSEGLKKVTGEGIDSINEAVRMGKKELSETVSLLESKLLESVRAMAERIVDIQKNSLQMKEKVDKLETSVLNLSNKIQKTESNTNKMAGDSKKKK